MPKRLLLADDSITIQKVVGITFAQEDFDITYVDNGMDAIDKVREVTPDIVLADIVMPKKNGYEVCEAIKQDPSTQTIPVLLLAGTFETFDVNRGKVVGADDYIIKPFESQALIDKVHELIRKTAQAASDGAPQSAPAPAAPQAATTPAIEEPISLEGEVDLGSVLDAGEAQPFSPPTLDIPAVENTAATEEVNVATVGTSASAPDPTFDHAAGQTTEGVTPQTSTESDSGVFDLGGDFGEVASPVTSDSAALDPTASLDAASATDMESVATATAAEIMMDMTATPLTEEALPSAASRGDEFGLGLEDDAPVSEPAAVPATDDLGLPDLGGAADLSGAPDLDGADVGLPDLDGADLGTADSLAAGDDALDLPPLDETQTGGGDGLSDFGFDATPDAAESTPEATMTPPPAAPQLSEEQVRAIIETTAAQLIEKIAWEVVPELAEKIIRNEITRLTQDVED